MSKPLRNLAQIKIITFGSVLFCHGSFAYGSVEDLDDHFGTTGLGLPCRGLPTNCADAALTVMVLDDLPGFVIELENLYS